MNAAKKRGPVNEGALLMPLDGKSPELGEGTWVAPNATVIGEVSTGADCSIWFQAVLRGDVGPITLGDQVNIQDGAVLHTTRNHSRVVLGNRVTVGHRAVVHGCTTEDDVLIGMGAIVLDNAHIGKGAIVAAGAVVLENTRVEPGSIYAGVPARLVKSREVEQAVAANRAGAEGYVRYKAWYEALTD